MTKTQALRAVELLGGINATARMIKNAQGQLIAQNNLAKAINNVRGVPDWLAEQLEDVLYKRMIDCSMVLHALEDDRLAESQAMR